MLLTLGDDVCIRRLGQKVFSKAASEAKSQKVDETWRESLYRVYKSGQQNMRVAVYGAKHDAATFETLLQDICTFDDPASTGNAMIDTAVLGTPKVQFFFMLIFSSSSGVLQRKPALLLQFCFWQPLAEADE